MGGRAMCNICSSFLFRGQMTFARRRPGLDCIRVHWDQPCPEPRNEHMAGSSFLPKDTWSCAAHQGNQPLRHGPSIGRCCGIGNRGLDIETTDMRYLRYSALCLDLPLPCPPASRWPKVLARKGFVYVYVPTAGYQPSQPTSSSSEKTMVFSISTPL